MELTDDILPIITPLNALYKKLRSKAYNVSTHTKSAQQITKIWQEAVVSDHIIPELRIKAGASEKIDIVDVANKTAYELKVSGKNVKHEFYKDLFKILIFNRNSQEFKLERFVFISEKAGINQLKKSTLFAECSLLIKESKYLKTIILIGIEHSNDTQQALK